MSNGKLLWVDDEIELLKGHILFLEKKGYEVFTVSNGQDALDRCAEQVFDLILLDENMPGLSGLETLSGIKEISPNTPVVMVTKSEEENLMNQAIGAKIADYLIKPVNPTQILLSLKKNIHKKELVTEVAQSAYQQDFSKIGMQINDSFSFNEWVDVYKKLVFWELELSETDGQMNEMLAMQKAEANNMFGKFIKKNYEQWILDSGVMTSGRPVMSPDVFKTAIFPHLKAGKKVFLLVLDNFRYDHWKQVSRELAENFFVEEDIYCSILPTATQYARNALFSGLMPLQIAQMFPELWVDEDEDEGKNLNEEELVATHLERYRLKKTFSYHKINESQAVEKLVGQFRQLEKYDLNIVVLNFRNPQQGNAWNPMSLPYELYKEGNSDKAIELLDDLAINILHDEQKSSDPFWNNTAADYFSGLSLGLFEDGTPEWFVCFFLFHRFYVAAGLLVTYGRSQGHA